LIPVTKVVGGNMNVTKKNIETMLETNMENGLEILAKIIIIMCFCFIKNAM